MTFSPVDAPSSPIFKELKILKLNDIITTNNIIFVHKTLNGMTPSHFKNFVEPYIPNHNHATRNDPSSGYSIPPGSVSLNNIEPHSLKYRCAQDWNEMLKTLSRSAGHTHKLLDVLIISLQRFDYNGKMITKDCRDIEPSPILQFGDESYS